MTCGGTGGLRPLRSASGSPEFATSRNTSTDASRTNGMEISRRRTMKLVMAPPHVVTRSRRGPVAATGPRRAQPRDAVSGLLRPAHCGVEGTFRGGVVVDVGEGVAVGDEGWLLVQRDGGHVLGELLVDLVGDLAGLGLVRLGDRLLEHGVDLGVGVLAVVAAAAGAVDVLAGGDGERGADPGEVADVEVAVGQG